MAGLGPLLGVAAGVGVGAALGLARAAGWRLGLGTGTGTGTGTGAAAAATGALIAGNAAMTLLGVTDPRSWSAGDWAADAAPHLAYGVVAATVLKGLTRA